jgi:hypothetical protein
MASAFLADMNVLDFLPWRAWKLNCPALHPSSWNYRCEPPLLAGFDVHQAHSLDLDRSHVLMGHGITSAHVMGHHIPRHLIAERRPVRPWLP